MSQQRPYDEEKAKELHDLLGYGYEKKEEIPPQSGDAGGGSEEPPTPPVAEQQDPPSKAGQFNFKPDKEKLLRALWTMASTISMVVNVVVIIILALFLKYVPIKELVSLGQEKVETLPPEIGLNTPLDLLQGLYDNFELMDSAHIKTKILVEDEIPVQFTLGLNQNTTVILSEAVTIPGARVALTTGGLNIFNAPATVVLPAGTKLPITLSLDVPVDEMIAISLPVEVDIALSDTDLHEPFVGLQEVVRPLYCLVKSDATNAVGEEICLKKIDQ